MNTAKRTDLDHNNDDIPTKEKTVFASGEVVFTHLEKGVWKAELYNREVLLNRLNYNHWVCVDEDSGELLGEGSTRNEAMREAFYHEVERVGYNPHEASRLDWILQPQKYRSYGGHKPRKRTKTAKTKDNVTPIRVEDRRAEERKQDDAVERVRHAFDKYRTAYNSVLGGWMYYKRDDKGKIEGEIEGPFKSERDMIEDMMMHELDRIAGK